MSRCRRVILLVAALGSGLLAGCGASGDADEAAVDGMPVGAPDATPDAIANDSDAITDAMVDDSDAIMDGSNAIADAMRDAEPDAQPPDAALDPNREHRCEDGLDGDGDGVADCADGDCLDADACRGVPMTPVERVQDLFIQRCGCHTGALDEGGLTLIRPFTDTTIGQPAVLDPERILIVPGDAQASFLYLKLLDGLPVGLGERMPPEIPYFDPDQLRLVADWIAGLTPR